MDPYMVTPQPSNQQNQALHGPVAILWDIENCCVPSNVRPEDVAGNIRMALRVHPVVQGVVTLFSAYGDFNSFSIKLREGCQRTGVKLTDVPNGRKDAADKAILVDMFLFALDNRPPSSIVLISGDVDFAPALHILGQRGYEIIIVVPSGICVSPALSNAGRSVWDWPSVARGEGSMPAKAFIYRGPNIATNLSGCHISDNRDEEESIVYRGMPQGDYIAQANINQMHRSLSSSHAYGDPTRASHSFSDNSSSNINLISMPSFPNTSRHSYPSNVFSGRAGIGAGLKMKNSKGKAGLMSKVKKGKACIVIKDKKGKVGSLRKDKKGKTSLPNKENKSAKTSLLSKEDKKEKAGLLNGQDKKGNTDLPSKDKGKTDVMSKEDKKAGLANRDDKKGKSDLPSKDKGKAGLASTVKKKKAGPASKEDKKGRAGVPSKDDKKGKAGVPGKVDKKGKKTGPLSQDKGKAASVPSVKKGKTGPVRKVLSNVCLDTAV